MVKRIVESDSSSDEDIPLLKRAKVDDVEADEKPAANGHAAAPAPAAAAAVENTGTMDEEPKPFVKAESPITLPPIPAKRPKPKPRSPSTSEDEAPLVRTAKPAKKAKRPASPTASTSSAPIKRSSSSSDSDSDGDEAPLAAKPKKHVTNGTSKKAKKRKSSNDDEDDDDFGASSDEEVKPKKAKKSSKPKAAASTKRVKKEEAADESDATVKPKKKSKKAVKTESSQVKEEDGSAAETEEEDGNHKWWEAEEGGAEDVGDGTVKWTTLQHNGVLFPPPYEPHGVKMNYDGHPVTLPPEAEEVATFFAAMLETDHAAKDVFRQNFFEDFLGVLGEFPPTDGTKITSFAKCDFKPIFEYCEEERLKKKSLSKDQKKQIKEAKDAIEEPFKIALLDGRKETVGNFRIEPPGLFRGRGAHPRTGRLKKRVRPEQITINIGEAAKTPEPPPGHKWGKVIHDNTVSWLAGWNENINGAFKYVFLGAGSSLKGRSDLKKYERARELKKHIDRIRRDYRADLNVKLMADRQRATALYLIDLFALRAGNEKGDEEADTVGCCSLRCEHITLSPPAHVQFDFLGKDSIRYLNDVDVDEQVHKNLRIFKKNKEHDDLLFDRLTTTIMNKHLGGYMKQLTAKVFRTYNASWTFQNELDKTNPNDSTADKILAYNRANRQVAILCNHQKTVSKTHGAAMEKMNDKLRALKYQRMKLRHTLFTIDSKNKKKHDELLEDESDLDDDWIASHEEDLAEKDREKIRKKFEKENEKLVAEGEPAQKQKVLDDRLANVDDNLERLKEERKTQEVEPKRSQTTDKVVAAIEKMDDRIKTHRTQALDKDEGKTTSLGTSKLNYLDPRLTFAWCKKYDVPVEKMFSKTLRDKFTWAADVAPEWRF